ncbi:MAG: RodZ domain-containing protein [Alphaproteobacteria bacterium]
MIGRKGRNPTPDIDRPKGFDDFDMRLGDLMRGERATMGKSLLDVQRDLKIKASYIAAIENADVSAFETQGFVAGYVRSYARYLGMEPDTTFARFCVEAQFEVAHGMSAAASTATVTAARNRGLPPENRDPFVNGSFVPPGETMLSRVQPGALGSLAVLITLIGALGYGGYSVLQEVQRVQLAPVNEAPSVVAEIDPLGNVAGEAPLVRSAPVVAERLPDTAADRLSRPEALTVPVLTARDGPIAAINPRDASVAPAAEFAPRVPGIAAAGMAMTDPKVQVVADAAPGVAILAVRPSWVRVSAGDGTVLFEKILDAGERYAVPPLQLAAVLRSGNSGSVYFVVNGKTYGPAAPGAQVVKNVSLAADSLTQVYALADQAGDVDLARFADATPVVSPVVPVRPEPGN